MGFKKFLKFFIVFFIIWTWVYVGHPQIWPFGKWQEGQLRLPPQVKEVGALTATSGDGIIVYSSTTASQTIWRTYDNTNNNFGSASGTVDGTANGLNYVIKTSPTKQEAIVAFVSSTTVYVLCYDGTNWSSEWSDTTVLPTNPGVPFDVAYETSSSDVMVLYSNGAIATNEMSYRTKSGTTGCGSANWSGATSLDTANVAGTYPISWVRFSVDRRTTSTLIAAIWSDYNRALSGQVWSGTAWGNEPITALETNLETAAGLCTVSGTTNCSRLSDFGFEYESGSGDLMVVWANAGGANGTNGAYWAVCTGGSSSCTWSATSTITGLSDDAHSLDISGNPNSDEIVFASLGAGGSDLQAAYWDGSTWTGTADLDTSTQNPATAGTKFVATGWLTSGATTRSVIVYADASPNATSTAWAVGNGSTFTVQTPFQQSPAYNATHRSYDIRVDPINKDRLMFTISDNANDLFAKRLAMDSTPTFTWTNADGSAALETNLSQALRSPFAFAYWRSFPYTPVVSAVSLNGGSAITLTENTTTSISVTGTITDSNGNGDISYATATIYRSGVTSTSACAASNNDCYPIASSSCTLSSCSGNSCSVSCTTNIWYYADPTDSGTYSVQNWEAQVTGVDDGGLVGSATSSVELNTLNALDVSDPVLYVGGDFTSIGGQTRNSMAALDLSTGTSSSWNPNVNGVVYSIIVRGSTIYIAGEFTNVGGQTRNHLAAIDVVTGTTTSWNPNVDGIVYSIVLNPSESTMFVAGDFGTIAGQTRWGIAEIGLETATTTSFNPNAQLSAAQGTVNGLFLDSFLYVGGLFDTIGGSSRNNIAALSLSKFTYGDATIWNPNANNQVRSLLLNGSTLYAAGHFTNIGGNSRNRIAALDTSTGSSTSWDPNANGIIFGNFAINGSTIYIGGTFTSIGGQTRNNITALNTLTGNATNWNPDASTSTKAILLNGSIAYVGGNFTSIGGQSRNRIAAIDLLSGSANSWNPNADSVVRIFALGGSPNYGVVSPGSDTGSFNPSTIILNTGNSAIDAQISGTNLTAGSFSIDVGNQISSTTVFTYSDCNGVNCLTLSVTPTTYELDLPKVTSTASVYEELFWGLQVPEAARTGVYSGTNTFTAVAD